MQRDYNLRKRHGSQIVHADQSTGENSTYIDCSTEAISEEIAKMRPENPETDTVEGKKPKEVEEEIEEIPVIEMKDFAVVDMDEKLNLIMVAINKINTSFHHKFEELNNKIFTGENSLEARIQSCETKIAESETALNDEQEGVVPRVTDIETNIEEIYTRLDKLEEEKIAMRDEVLALQGIAQVHDKKINNVDKKVIDLTARGMKNNIIIHGIMDSIGDEKENCKTKALEFIRDKMKMEIKEDSILVAHRIGKKASATSRPIIIKCTHDLRNNIFSYVKNLKDLKNDQNEPLRVSSQLPEPLHTKSKEMRERIYQTKVLNKTLDDTKKIQIEVKNGMLWLNGKIQKKHVHPPTVMDMMNINQNVQSKIDKIELSQSEPITEKGSVFTGYAARVHNTSEVKIAYKKAKQIAPEADHVIMAYSVKQYDGAHDDGEHGASKRILSILKDRNSVDKVVFVTRIFGGQHLGPKRFLHIEKAAKDALHQLQSSSPL